MDYFEAIDYFCGAMARGVKPGLSRVLELLNRLGSPEKSVKIVHIAGTNGKGSTGAALAAILSRAGFRTGLFSSPVVICYLEQVMVDGVFISEADFARCATIVREAAEGMEELPTEFEMLTALMFLHFKLSKCDIAVVEAGLGGLLDSTNVKSECEVAALTRIGIDHTAILGDTIEQIAEQKCGIIKPECVVVNYPMQDPRAEAVIRRAAGAKKCELVRVGETSINSAQCTVNSCGRRNAGNYTGSPLGGRGGNSGKKILSCAQNESFFGSVFFYEGEKYYTRYIAPEFVYNLTLAIEAAKALGRRGFDIPLKAIKEGIAESFLPARQEIISNSPFVLLDGGHNVDCAEALSGVLKRQVCGRHKKITAIVAMLVDKDVRGYLERIAPLCDAIIVTEAISPRKTPAEQLAAVACEFCDDVRIEKDIAKAISVCVGGDCQSGDDNLQFTMKSEQFGMRGRRICAVGRRDEAVIICGSFYLCAEARRILLK